MRSKGGTSVTMATEHLLMPMLASPATAGLARTLAEQRLCKWDCSHISDDALLVVTELITNAIRETPGQEIKLALRREAGAVVIGVWDRSPRPPRPAPPVEPVLDGLDLSEHDFDTDGGRGLHLVAALSAGWGHQPDPIDPATGRLPGKWVWARLRT
ncbi:ATP-binding protein [Actinomadura scrupuli]|uniref:ATP-binding protein n=1 Tax=Actinomadura scrupuli TaxID=559629 RepID=UPI003D9652CD